MKLIKFLLGTIAIAIFPVCTVAIADDCFDTIVDKSGKVYYIDPLDNYKVFEDKKSLTSTHGDKIKCSEEKKVYSMEEYLDKTYGDLYKGKQKQKSESSGGGSLIELVMLILSCVAMWKIFVKAGKPGIYSIIPIYNFYELSDIAGLQGMFWKVLICGLVGIGLCLFIPILGMILIFACVLYGVAVDFYVARNFGWSTRASILYVIFNPIAMLILAFGNYEYDNVKGVQKEEIREIAKKIQNDEVMGKEKGGNTKNNANNITPEVIDEEFDDSIPSQNNTETGEDPIKYIDPSQFQ